MLYFAYGSNMSSARLQARVPSASMVAVAYLPKHHMGFTKTGVDGSAKCGIDETGNTADKTYGVVFEFDPSERHVLDQCEGLGVAYEERYVTVYTEAEKALEVLTYYPLDKVDGLTPWAWYKAHVLNGAKEFNLPVAVVHSIEAVTAAIDPELERRQKELAIHQVTVSEG